jgi:hypothetical protein
VASLHERYGAASRQDKTRILQEFVAISGYHRKSAIRVLKGTDAIRVGIGRHVPSTTRQYVKPCKYCGRLPIGCAASD